MLSITSTTMRRILTSKNTAFNYGRNYTRNVINLKNPLFLSNSNSSKHLTCCSCTNKNNSKNPNTLIRHFMNINVHAKKTTNFGFQYRGSTQNLLNFKYSTSTTPNHNHPPSSSPASSNDEDPKHSSENIYTIPNLLCVARIGMAPVLGYMIITSQFTSAIGIFALAGFTDLLDGWIARSIPGQSSLFGSFLDPLSDKILVGSVFVSLTYMDLIPLSLTALIVARDVLLISAGFYIRYQSLESPRTLSRYFDATMATAQLAPTFISKVNTGIQLGLVGVTLLSTVLPNYDIHPYLVALWYFTAGTTICSALSYIFTRNTYTILKHSKTWRAKHLSKIKKTLGSSKEDKVSKS